MERESAMKIARDMETGKAKNEAIDRAVSPNMHPGYRITKRLFDIVASALAILVFSPIMLITAIAIKIEDPHGKVFYKAPRGGKDRVPFACYNLRWMKTIDDSHREWAARRPVSCATRIIQKPERGFRHQSGHFKPAAAAESGAFRRPSEPAPIHRTA